MQRRTILWTLFAIVAVFEALVLVMIATPRVSAEYQAYFIDRSSKCWPRNASGEISLDQRISFLKADARGKADNVLECGWQPASGSGTWSEGPESRLKLTVPEGPLQLVFNVIPFVTDEHAQQRVSFWANGQLLDEIVLIGREARELVLSVPPDATADGELTLSLRYPDAISPAELGLGNNRSPMALGLVFLTARSAAS